ncbi:hypothetical protein HHI36_011891 [Cryptolaemus montrouzieri]|uniref:Uncharacterized protein n=1 Tax=Cryptolaemus montrouzieri TaxID=559131 RepID=A0ABD2NCN1_9CUCU
MFSVTRTVLCVYLILSVLVDYIDSGNLRFDRTNSRSLFETQRHAACDGFECKQSHDCINQDKYCDGAIDCPDRSDETNDCRNVSCSSYLFRCSYGACIDPLFECDGKRDCADGSDENTLKCKNISSTKRCTDGEFRCKSGQCIDKDNKCDGIPHCTDRSDETLRTCSLCPSYSFQCRYGACVSSLGVCNGISDCADGSDEDPELCKISLRNFTPATPSLSLSSRRCILPNPENGKFNISALKQDALGESVPEGAIINISCQNGYIAVPDHTLSYCIAGRWNPSLPLCKKICPPFMSTEVMEVTCRYNGVVTNCSTAIDHTIAEFNCKPYHKLSTIENFRYCFDGSWSEDKPNCRPICGEKRVQPKKLIIGGQIADRGNYPWTIAIYKKKTDNYKLICGGTLINQRVIVTAAHCVTDKEGNILEKSIYRVAAGKYYLSYDDPRDTDAEFSEIEEIHSPGDYKGNIYDYDNDIAVLVTKIAFNTTEYIQRCCVDFNQFSSYESQLLGAIGTVTGWGYTIRGGNQSQELKELNLPYVDHTTCYRTVPYDYKKYVKSNKVCAGYRNRGIGVCEGDSGGGLVFENLNDKRFYLRGVVSISVQKEGKCNENEYAIYTKVSSYIPFIAEIERKYRN